MPTTPPLAVRLSPIVFDSFQLALILLSPWVIGRVLSAAFVHATSLAEVAGKSETLPLMPSIISLPSDHMMTDGAFLSRLMVLVRSNLAQVSSLSPPRTALSPAMAWPNHLP